MQLNKLRVRFFISKNVNDLQREINSWLRRENKSKFESIGQSLTDNDYYVVAIWYSKL